MPPLSPKRKEKRVNWATKYKKLVMKRVPFSYELRATLNGQDSWGKGWPSKETRIILGVKGNNAVVIQQ